MAAASVASASYMAPAAHMQTRPQFTSMPAAGMPHQTSTPQYSASTPQQYPTPQTQHQYSAIPTQHQYSTVSGQQYSAALPQQQYSSTTMQSPMQSQFMPSGAMPSSQHFSRPPMQYTTAGGTSQIGRPGFSVSNEPANFYRPDNTEYVAPGQPLRGGMHPIYDMNEVRTYEAYPIFHSSPMVQDRGVSNASSDVDHPQMEHKQKHVSSRQKPDSSKRRLCC